MYSANATNEHNMRMCNGTHILCPVFASVHSFVRSFVSALHNIQDHIYIKLLHTLSQVRSAAALRLIDDNDNNDDDEPMYDTTTCLLPADYMSSYIRTTPPAVYVGDAFVYTVVRLCVGQ